MIRRIALAGVAGALALGGLAVGGAGTAGAAKHTITAATSANISCTITAVAKLKPGLANNWHQSAHSSDPNPDVVAIPNTTFGSPVTATSAKAKSVSCTGSASDALGTAAITGLKITLGQGTQAVDNPPLGEPGTCSGLLAGTQPGDVAATYTSFIKFKTAGAKLDPVTVSGQGIAPSGAGFAITGGTLSGSISGGGANSKSQAYVDGETVNAVGQAPATSTSPTPAHPQCEASIKIKTGTHHSAKLKKPKGLKKILIGNNLLPPFDASHVCIRKGSTCP